MYNHLMFTESKIRLVLLDPCIHLEKLDVAVGLIQFNWNQVEGVSESLLRKET